MLSSLGSWQDGKSVSSVAFVADVFGQIEWLISNLVAEGNTTGG